MKIKTIPDSLKHIELKPILRRYDLYAKKSLNKELKQAAIPVARLMLKNGSPPIPLKQKAVETPSVQFTAEQIKEYGEKQIHVVEVAEARFEKALEQFIMFVEKGFLQHLDQEVDSRNKFAKFVQKDYFADNEDDLLTRAQLDLTPLLESVATIAGNEALKLIHVKDPYIPFDYRKQIIANVEKFTKSLLDTDREALVNIITNGLKEGSSVPEIRNQITEKFSTFSKTQAQRITRTEVIRASNQSAIDAWRQSDVVEGKQWVIFGASDECADYDGQVVKLSGSFYDSDSEFADGDPPLHPNCKCVLIPVIDEVKEYIPDNTPLYNKIAELEKQIDKRTKSFKDLKATHNQERLQRAEDKASDLAYIKALEKYLGVEDEQI